MSYYPAFIDLAGQRCVVIGGGPAAAAKARGLLQAGASVDVVATQPCPEFEALAVRLLRRPFRSGDLAGARLAIDTTANPAVRAEATAQGVLLNVMDRPAECDFIAPAVVSRGPLQVAISTSGESPFLASAVRARLEQVVGEEWRELVKITGRLRRDLRRRGVPLAEQTAVYQRLLDSPVLDLLREGAVAAAQREVERVVAASRIPMSS